MIKLIFLILLCGCASNKVVQTEFIPTVTPELSDLHAYFNCTLFKEKDVLTYPGNFCVFNDDGSFLSGTHNGIRKIRADNSVEWEIERPIHHQVNLSPDKKRILTLSSTYKLKAGKTERDDVILILDENGKVLHEQSGTWLLGQTGLKPLYWPILENNPGASKADIDVTHFNSIYEIPENTGAAQASYLAPGNIIINSSALGIFILAPDLKKLLYHTKAGIWLIHDVQVTPDGEFIFFNNIVTGDKSAPNPYSSIDKYNPVTRMTTFRWTSEPKEVFYATTCGGVQELGDYIFFSHIVTGGYLYSKSRKMIVKTVPPGNSTPLKPKPVQQIKLLDVRKFLQNHGK